MKVKENMITAEMIQTKLIHYFKETQNTDVTADTHLIDEGVIDSMGVIELLTFINKIFGIEFEDEDITAANLSKIFVISKLIMSKNPTKML